MIRSNPPVTAVVLAGGRSSRFGSSKLDSRFGATSVLGATIEGAAAAYDEVVVVVPALGSFRPGLGDDRSVPDLGSRVRMVEDEEAFGGPLAGLVRGLEAVTTERVVTVGGDMPLVRPEVLRLLVAWLDEPVLADAAILDAAPLHPLPIAVRREPALLAASRLVAEGQGSLRSLCTALSAVAVPASAWRALDPDGDSLVDVDRPDDLVRALARAAARRA